MEENRQHLEHERDRLNRLYMALLTKHPERGDDLQRLRDAINSIELRMKKFGHASPTFANLGLIFSCLRLFIGV